MWGQAHRKVKHGFFLGIIPMRVGTRVIFQLKMALEKDHPHACGDKQLANKAYHIAVGSSPCVWGQDFFGNVFINPVRIIPMRVGTSVLQYLLYLLDEDHPHACGDKLCRTPTTADFAGSSPCVWGQEL